MRCYSEDTDLPHHQVHIKLVGEAGLDAGGIRKELFSVFWDQVTEDLTMSLFHGEGAKVPVLSANNTVLSLQRLQTLGGILSHTFILTGVFPTQLCMASMVYMATLDINIHEETLLDSFLAILPIPDRDLITIALQKEIFDPSIFDKLMEFYTLYRLHHLPTTTNLKQDMLSLARFKLILEPMSALTAMREGIPKSHMNLWKSMSVEGLSYLYSNLKVTNDKVLSTIAPLPVLRPEEHQVVYYLRTFIQEADVTTLKKFMQFVTGAAYCTKEPITLEFNGATGMERAPHASTCGQVLVLPTSYTSYSEFKGEFSAVLNNSYSFLMLKV